MANTYTATYEPIPKTGSFVNQHLQSRSKQIITDTLQSAMSLARAHCQAGEEVTAVFMTDRDPIIDYSVCKGPN